MKLKDFISNTIEQISLGILEASKKCNQYGVIVNPNITNWGTRRFLYSQTTRTR